MRLEWMQLFAAVAKHLSVTKAAAEHHVSQPAVSKQLRLFQDSIGVTLFTRQGRGIALTKSGREVLRDVQEILNRLEQFQKKYSKGRPAVNIAVNRSLSMSSVTTLTASFIAKHRSVEVNLFCASSAEIWQWFESSAIDFAILNGPPPLRHYRAEPFRRDRMIAFGPPMHLSVNGRLAHETSLILRAARPGETRTEQQVAELRRAGRKISIAMRCGSAKAVREAVARGAGIGILYRDAIEQEIERGEFKAVEVPGLDLRRSSYIVYPKRKRLSPMAQELLLLLRENTNTNVPVLTEAPRPAKRRRDRPRESNRVAEFQ